MVSKITLGSVRLYRAGLNTALLVLEEGGKVGARGVEAECAERVKSEAFEVRFAC